MKLGDNVTTDAYSIWGDVPPRKCRPPKIGDIPKHSAIDEESPSSITKSLTVATSDPRDFPLDPGRSIVFPLPSSASSDQFASSIRRSAEFAKGSIRFQYPLPPTKQALTASLHSPNKSQPCVESLPIKQPGVPVDLLDPGKDFSSAEQIDDSETVTIKLPQDEGSSLPRLGDREDSSRAATSPEDNSDQVFVEVRKDSALFLEQAEGLPVPREILKGREPRFVRPRRESSGYASNLGTFDEDRRNSSASDTLQDSLPSFLKDRRRSSQTGPKRFGSRLIQGRTQESLTEEEARMPSTEVHRNVSGAGLEMPGVVQVKEEAANSSESLGGLVKNVSNDDVSARCRCLGDSPGYGASAKGSPEVLDSSREDSFAIVDAALLGGSIDRLSLSPSPKGSPTELLPRSATLLIPSPSLQNVPRPFRKTEDRSTNAAANSASSRLEDDSSRNAPVRMERRGGRYCEKEDARATIPSRSIKMYQLLSTQSEDTADGEFHLDRRIAFRVSKHAEITTSIISSCMESRIVPLNKSSSALALRSSPSGDTHSPISVDVAGHASATRNPPSPGEPATGERSLGDPATVSARPIYPYCPYSPYGSPQGSPRNKRRPLRESRRVSIDNRQGALQLNQYKLLDNIGQGSYGIVKLVYNEEDDTHYAMKILSKKKLMKKAGIFGRMAPGRKGSANPLVKVYREIALLKKLDHPNVVKLVEVLDDPDEDNLYLVFELVQRGEILQVPSDKPLDEETARKNFRDVVLGVEYLHYQRIIHRDIKPSNLLVDSEGRIKIADLGVSAELRACGELLSGPAGTPAFAAPETTTPGARYSGTSCDVWSMGVTLYCLVTGRIPWDGAGSIIGVQAAVRSEPLTFPEKPELSQDLRDLISKMLAKDPAERITLSGMKNHVWLTDHGAEPLPSEADNCRLPVTVTDEEVERVVTRIPKLDTLILIKTMLKQHSFQNPFLPKKGTKTTCGDAAADSLELSPSGRVEESLPERDTVRNAKSERFQRTGRSNSAPDSYDWQTNGIQIAVDSALPPVTEASSQEAEIEKR